MIGTEATGAIPHLDDPEKFADRWPADVRARLQQLAQGGKQ